MIWIKLISLAVNGLIFVAARESDNHYPNRGHPEMTLIKDQTSVPREKETSTDRVPATSPKSTDTAATVSASEEKTMDFSFSTPLDFNKTVHLRWNFDKDSITLQLAAPSTGWIGIGFSTTGSMMGADLIIMGKTAEGVYAVDTHAESNGTPDVDQSQDIEIISGIENGTHTAITVKRKRITCDADDMSLKDGTYRVLWAYGEKDLVNTTPTGINYHGKYNRGAKSIKLINPVPRDVKGSPDAYFDIVASNFTVPAKDTFYLCKAIKIPNATEKRHVLRISPRLQPGNERNVHHILIYICDNMDARVIGKDFECYEDINPWRVGCAKTIAGWAVGMSDIVFPPDVGFPVGGGNWNYVMLQTHYDNPKMRAFQDNSGMRFYYAEKLQKLEAGLMTVSASVNSIFVPPDTGRFLVNGYCSELCLSKGMEISDTDEVTVISTALHSHLAGRRLVLHHYRDGKELKPFAKEDYYDFDYQENQYVDIGTVKIKKGDSFRMECNYETTGRDEVMTGGLSTRNEMCNAFVLYYPQIKLDFCNSAAKIIDTTSLMQLAAGLNISVSVDQWMQLFGRIRADPNNAIKIVATVLDTVDWTDEKKKFAESFTNNLDQRPVCIANNNWLLGYTDDEFSVPKYEDYVEEDECKSEEKEGGSSSSIRMSTIVGSSTVLLILLALGLSFRRS